MKNHEGITRNNPIALYDPPATWDEVEPKKRAFIKVTGKKQSIDPPYSYWFWDELGEFYPALSCFSVTPRQYCYVRVAGNWQKAIFKQYVGSNPIKAEVTVSGELMQFEAKDFWALWSEPRGNSLYDIFPCDVYTEGYALLMAEAVAKRDRGCLETLRELADRNTLKQAYNAMLSQEARQQIYNWVVELNKEAKKEAA